MPFNLVKDFTIQQQEPTIQIKLNEVSSSCFNVIARLPNFKDQILLQCEIQETGKPRQYQIRMWLKGEGRPVAEIVLE